MAKQRDDADRRAGAAERKNEGLVKAVDQYTSWFNRAKAEAGYAENVSFDDVWRVTLENAAGSEPLGAYPLLKTAVSVKDGMKHCPFCGSKPDGIFQGIVTAVNCSNRDCIAYCRQVSVEAWNTRYTGAPEKQTKEEIS